jgi:ribonuclease J
MKLYTLGGYNEVGNNMTAVEVRDEIVILDMGYHMEELMDLEEEVEAMPSKLMIEKRIIPDDKVIYAQREKVKGIIIGHGHLDHVGGVAYLAGSYNCPIISSPYTMKIIEQQISENKKEIKNRRIVLNQGETYNLTSKIAVEFVKVTHSIPDAMLTVLHTPEGRLAYGLDFRLDNNPVLGETADTDRLEELGREGIKILIGDSTRVGDRGNSISESSVRDQLRYKLNQVYRDNTAVVVTTFSSHIERLKSILEVNNGRRKVAFIGRSLKEYTLPASELGYIKLNDVEIASYSGEVNKLFKKISKNRDEWLIVCTGNQGEDRSVLSRLSREDYEFKLESGDHVIFSSSTIPTVLNRAERYKLERDLKKLGAKLHFDIHTSGHGHREDLRALMNMLKPEIMIPGHGDIHKLAEHAALAQEEGYVLNENLFICENGTVMDF